MEGTTGHQNAGYVDFEIAIAKIQEADGKIGVTVLGLGGADAKGKVKSENISKVKFSVRLRGALNKLAPTKWPPGGS
jgi:hypothetical protein